MSFSTSSTASRIVNPNRGQSNLHDAEKKEEEEERRAEEKRKADEEKAAKAAEYDEHNNLPIEFHGATVRIATLDLMHMVSNRKSVVIIDGSPRVEKVFTSAFALPAESPLSKRPVERLQQVLRLTKLDPNDRKSCWTIHSVYAPLSGEWHEKGNNNTTDDEYLCCDGQVVGSPFRFSRGDFSSHPSNQCYIGRSPDMIPGTYKLPFPFGGQDLGLADGHYQKSVFDRGLVDEGYLKLVGKDGKTVTREQCWHILRYV